MKRRALLIIAAAAVVAAIVVLATGAFAGTAGRSDQPGDGFAAFVSCLASHRVQAPSDDPAAVKRWLADRQSDPVVQAALEACAGRGPGGGRLGARTHGGRARGLSRAARCRCSE